ncbi:sn-glycerol-3-phosphate import ATP-binding protein UgpC 2 [Devosia yakushimensis]|uniref:Sn-glycerol-3-phosphate import ATP-binding protein UgpC 2 n=1 Tax=Devosia yakushimensis TaxID=470028 RepID=A0ABQ5UDA1_9HYPH|nr:sn-glycerol-3-phosphate ABC transporter ATP-binding protein UgpC [Devosia yakushimensis]GLQ09710.1 sn-glycerol-3-phosphate import ATP-binding protein UgpC 2 [Devosia yakushimensis]
MGELALSALKKTYEGKQVLHGIDVEIADGQFVVIVGPSGCGKSTLLRMIAGLEDITEGTITIDGTVMNDIDPADRGCAMVFQNYALYPHMTVRQNMAYPLRIAGLPQAERDRKVEEAAAILSLTDYLDRRPAQLSGGQRQRVAMGRAIVREPSVFLFDEPLSNLDATLRVQMRIEIKRLHKRLKATSIFVTHDQVEAMTLADLLIVMNGGRVEQVGTPAAVYRNPASTFVAGFMGAPAMNLMPASVGANGAVTLDIAPQLPLLEVPELAAGTLVTLGIRPEAIGISFDSTRGLPATVDLVEELGGSRVAYCAVKSLELAIVLPPGDESYEGRQVFLDFGKAWHIFDRLTGKRIETAAREARGGVGQSRLIEA